LQMDAATDLQLAQADDTQIRHLRDPDSTAQVHLCPGTDRLVNEGLRLPGFVGTPRLVATGQR